jgi:hypothetical protein
LISWLNRTNSEKRLLVSSCLPIRLSASLSVCFRMALNGHIYVPSDIGGLLQKSVEILQILFKVGQKYRALYMKT